MNNATVTAEPQRRTAKRGSEKILWTAGLKISGTAVIIDNDVQKSGATPAAVPSSTDLASACSFDLIYT